VSASQNFFAFLIKGGLMMVPLLASSILALAVVIERWWFWQRFRTQENGERILALVAAGLLTQAMQMARASHHPVAKVLYAGLEHRSSAPTMAMEAHRRPNCTASDATSRCSIQLLRWLRSWVCSAPLRA
jgi:biopolymer transport protein ExbB